MLQYNERNDLPLCRKYNQYGLFLEESPLYKRDDMKEFLNLVILIFSVCLLLVA